MATTTVETIVTPVIIPTTTPVTAPTTAPTTEEPDDAVSWKEFLDELNKNLSTGSTAESTDDNALDDYVGISFEKLTKKDIESVCNNKFTQTVGVNTEGKLLSLRSHGDKTIEMDYYEYEGFWYNVHGEKVSLAKINPKLANYISKIKDAAPAYIFSQIINKYCVENKLNKVIETAISAKTTPRVICGIVGKETSKAKKPTEKSGTGHNAGNVVIAVNPTTSATSPKKSSKNQDQPVLKYTFIGKLKPYGIFETEITLPTGQTNTHKFYVFCK